MDHLRESSVVGGRFRLIEPVGTGRPAGVWRAADLATGQDVAVKVLDAFPAADIAAQARFRLVARTLAQLSAPGLAGVREFGEAELDGGRSVPYLVRDLISGLLFAGGGTVKVTGGDGSEVFPWLSTATTL